MTAGGNGRCGPSGLRMKTAWREGTSGAGKGPVGRAAAAALLLTAAVAFSPCAPSEPERRERSAVLFIGDGMGPAYVTATRVARGGSSHRLRLDTLPHTAVCRTYSADSPVTDSAAAASAMACGQKTANGVLCEDATAVHARRAGRRLESIASWAKTRGLRAGLVTTTTVTHATPAAFYAGHHDREDERAIARQAIDSRLDFLLGGGRRFFRGPGAAGLEGAARVKGWRIVGSAADLRAVASLDRPVLGLFAEGDLPYEAEPRGRAAPRLAEMTRWAIDVLKADGRPFFLMVEGGRIDHAGHANWARTLVDETAAFDEAVGYAIDTLDPSTTLVLVTADHETGGLAINGYPEEKDGIWGTYRGPLAEGDRLYPVVTFSSGPGTKQQTRTPPHGSDDPRPSGISLPSAAHTGVDVTLYAWGKSAERVHGTLENTDVYSILRAHLEGR